MAFTVRRPDTFGDGPINNGFGNEFDAQDPRSRRLTAATRPGAGGRIIGKTSSGGFVRTRSDAEIAAANKKSSSVYSNKRKRKRNNPVNNVVDVRHVRSNNGGVAGQILGSIIDRRPADIDDRTNTLKEYLRRKIDSNDQEFLRGLSSGVIRLPQGGVVSVRKNQQFATDSRTRAIGGGFGGSGSAGGGGGRAGIASSGGTIGLPTPDNLVENMRLNYSSRALPVFHAIQNALQKGLKAGAEGIIGENAGGMTPAAATQAMQDAAGIFDELRNDMTTNNGLKNLLRMGDMVGSDGVNDGATSFNNTMLQQFEGVQPRTFSFNWKLYAANAGESSAIFRIIDLLKKASHPTIVNPVLDIIEYPMTLKNFEIRSPTGVIIFPIFESVISGITVDYSASGAPYFFKGGAPTSIGLTLTITEIRSLTREDW